MGFLSSEFTTYIAPQTDRCAFIQDWLLKHGVESAVAAIDGKKHILVQFAPNAYDARFKIKTVIAHYDRVEGSPGANDNSAADWQIMNWAAELAVLPAFHNVRIFFTDGEELGWNTGVSGQGAFGIASTFKKLGITNDDVYVFDCCGRGEVPVLSKTVLPKELSESGNGGGAQFVKRFNNLFERTQDLLREASPERWMTLPVPYSDNASFLACGIPAVAITMLPAEEASLYARELLSNKGLEAAVMNRESSKKERLEENRPEYAYKERMPKTWRLFHTEYDNELSLTQNSFVVMKQILNALANTKTL